MSDLISFVQHNVEGYLFHDLREMQRISVGYPLLMTTFAGIELLGGLTSGSRFDKSNGASYFTSYWKAYLYPQHQHAVKISQVLYNLMRHGIAHGFVLKGPMAVVGGQPAMHLTRDSAGIIYVDATQLANDFMNSFLTTVKPLMTATTGLVNASSMEARAREMEADYQHQAGKWPGAALFPTTVATTTAASHAAILPSGSRATVSSSAAPPPPPGGKSSGLGGS